MQKSVISVLAVASLVVFCSSSEAKPRKAKAPVAAASAAPAAPAPVANGGDWSLAEKEYWSKLQEEMDANMARANTKCGTSIKGTFDKESFRGQFKSENGSYGIDSYTRAHCGAAPSALEDICTTVNGNEERAKMAKDAVKSKITTYECKFGGKGKQSMNLAGGKLAVSIDPNGDDNASSLQSKLVTYTKDKL